MGAGLDGLAATGFATAVAGRATAAGLLGRDDDDDTAVTAAAGLRARTGKLGKSSAGRVGAVAGLGWLGLG